MVLQFAGQTIPFSYKGCYSDDRPRDLNGVGRLDLAYQATVYLCADICYQQGNLFMCFSLSCKLGCLMGVEFYNI